MDRPFRLSRIVRETLSSPNGVDTCGHYLLGGHIDIHSLKMS